MEENKVIAYSFLAHLNNDMKGNGFNDIFIPLVKRTLSIMSNNQKNMGQITDIKEEFNNLYKLDIPYPMLKELLKTISIEIKKNNEGSMELYKDFSYVIKEYTFDNYEETILYKKSKIEKLQEKFKCYIQENAVISQYEGELDLFKFIDRNRTKLSKVLSENNLNIDSISDNADIEMNFIKYLKKNDIELYEVLKDIYIGSIISAYIELDALKAKSEAMNFIVDTNFIISLMGLHGEENMDTCNKIVDICNRIGYKIKIADITIEETEHILNKIIDGYEKGIIERFRYNSTSNVCERNNITKTDIQYKVRNLMKFLTEKKISIIYLKQKYKNELTIKNGEIYKQLDKIDYTDKKSILHDAIIIDYVSNKRNNGAKKFADLKIWFLTESKKFNEIKTKFKYSEAINTNELVNLLWLIKPVISTDDIFKLGLSNLFAEVIEANQPSKRIIREIDSNINKYKENISDDDIIALGSLVSDISLNKIKNINSQYEEVNELLKNGDYYEFSEKIKEMKGKQEELKQIEIDKINKKHNEEKKNEFNNFVNILIDNKIYENSQKNLENEYRKIDINKGIEDIRNKTIDIIKRISIGLIIIVAILFIIYKNSTENIFEINFIDIMFFMIPILFSTVFNAKVFGFAENISKKINGRRYKEIEEINKSIKEIEYNSKCLYEIKDILIKAENIEDKINELIVDSKYEKYLKEIRLEELIQNKKEIQYQ
ncbi:MAG: hypothetical protein ACLU07_06590 [Lachnospirales bacterium]